VALPSLPDPFGNYALRGFTHLAEPDGVSLWPGAPGWQILASLLALWLALLGWRHWQRWRRNRYRREALAALRAARTLGPEKRLQVMARLLKASALAAFPRQDVAALSGESWLDWLDRHAPEPFSLDSRRLLAAGQYRAGEPPETRELELLDRECERWLCSHREAAL